MKYIKFLLIILAVIIVTTFSIYINSNADSIASQSYTQIFAISDSTQTHDGCCKGTEGCSDMKSSSDHDKMMMNHEKHEDDKNAGEHKHGSDDNDTKKDDHSGCMGH